MVVDARPPRLPWDFHLALSEERLRYCARLLANARRDAFALAARDMGDDGWSIGCRAYAFSRHRLKRVADSREHPWLRIMEDGLHFVFLIGQVPVRFYRGPASEPTARVLRRHETEAQQLQLALGLGEGDGLAFRIALETNDKGGVERVVFLVLRGEEGQAECVWPIPLALSAEATPSSGAQLRLITDDGYEGPSGSAFIRPGAAARRRTTAARRLAG